MAIASVLRKQIDRIEYALLPRRFFRDKVYVILYHSVALKKHFLLDNMSDAIFQEADDFAAQMAYIASHYHVAAVKDYINGSIEKESLVITFDDGFRDVLLFAYPILEKLNLPFAVCINSGFVDNKNLFWLSKINYLRSRGLFDRFKKEYGIRHPITKFDNNLEMDQNLIAYFRQNNLDIPQIAQENQLYLSQEEIRQMSPDLLTILPHTHNHYKTTDLTGEQRQKELEASIIYCRETFPEYYQPVFSFPFGSPEKTFDRKDIDILNKNDIQYYFSAENGINTLNSGKFEIKRKSVFRNQGLKRFKYFIERPQILSHKAKALKSLL